MAAEAAGSRSAESDFPAERAFPVTVVIIHGVLAVTTVTLVLLTVLGAGEADAGTQPVNHNRGASVTRETDGSVDGARCRTGRG
jgi:hypothetical protein